VELVINRVGQGKAGQPLRGATRGAISIKEILGENRNLGKIEGPASNQRKIQFFFKLFSL